ncbi:MAG: DUF1987 domain-containing protein [Bacteroidetes bacterium]|nr:DUF1987 domain-containing protein [Bacteroidota bacterium]
MKDLYIISTKTTPEIRFCAESGVLEFSGSSYPEDPFEFYEPSVIWLSEYIRTGRPLVCRFRLDYYNTSSSKQILDIIDMLEEYFQNGGKVEAEWYYKEGDDEIRDTGDDFFEGIEMPARLIAY